jgi:glutamate-1-semialdehyde 2,1-aminomutase
MILGHQDDDVLQAIQKAIEKAISFGAPCAYEVELAELICELIPSVDQIRMVNSGTEATMTALRLARGYTGRDLIVKFEGCYHGHSDSLLIKAGSGALTLGQPSSPGIPADISKHTLNLTFNDIDELERAFAQYGDKIAAVIVEPVPGNMGCVLPNRHFLIALREATTRSGAVLIFDEVISGFRVGLTGAGGLYQIQPDLTTFGKIIGGGMPVGALGGKKAIMSHLSPVGPVYQAGTLSGNPVAMAAGIATISKLRVDPTFYDRLGITTQILVNGLKDIAQKNNIPVQINSLPGMFTLFFSEKPVNGFSDVMAADVNRFKTVLSWHVK